MRAAPLLGLCLCVMIPPSAHAAPRYTVIALDNSGRFDSEATAINSSGNVVGNTSYADPVNDDKQTHAFSFASGHVDGVGGWESSAASINASGQFVGEIRVNYDDYFHGYFFSSDGPTDLRTLPGMSAENFYPNAINDSGQIVGDIPTPSVDVHASIYANGVVADLGTLGGGYSSALAINNSGQIVGHSQAAPGHAAPEHAFLFTGGAMTDLGTLGGNRSSALAINDHGQIVGQSEYQEKSSATHPFLYANGKMRDLGTLGGPYSSARGINNHGEIVGSSSVSKKSAPHAFLFINGKMIDLNDLVSPASSWVVEFANDINDAGLIVGSGTKKGSSRLQALLLAPVFTITIKGGPARTTHNSRLVIHGRTAASVRLVTFRIGSRGRFHPAIGTANWHFTARLHSGANAIALRALGLGGNRVAARLIVTRR